MKSLSEKRRSINVTSPKAYDERQRVMSPADALKNEIAFAVLLFCWLIFFLIVLWPRRSDSRGHIVGPCLMCGAELREADVCSLCASRLPEQRGVLCGRCSRVHFRPIV